MKLKATGIFLVISMIKYKQYSIIVYLYQRHNKHDKKESKYTAITMTIFIFSKPIQGYTDCPLESKHFKKEAVIITAQCPLRRRLKPIQVLLVEGSRPGFPATPQTSSMSKRRTAPPCPNTSTD